MFAVDPDNCTRALGLPARHVLSADAPAVRIRHEGGAPDAPRSGPRAVAVAPIADAAEVEHLLTVDGSADHETEPVHGSLRATRQEVDTRGDWCELWDCGKG